MLLDRNSLNYNTDFNETIISSTNIIYILLKAGSTNTNGINFLLSWSQVADEYSTEIHEFEVIGKYKNVYILNH